MIREKQRGDKAEGKDLTFMQMAGQLKIKQALALLTDQGPVLEENGELIVGESAKYFTFRHIRVHSKTFCRRIVYSD